MSAYTNEDIRYVADHLWGSDVAFWTRTNDKGKSTGDNVPMKAAEMLRAWIKERERAAEADAEAMLSCTQPQAAQGSEARGLVGEAGSRMEFCITEAEALLKFFGGSNTSVTVQEFDAGHWPDVTDATAGKYAWCTDCPEEGAQWLGEHDPDVEIERAAVPDGEVRLWDSQWLNIVNHENCYREWSKEDAIAHAVKMTESAIARNIADGKLPPPRTSAALPLDAKGEG